MQTTDNNSKSNVHGEPTGCQNVARHLFKNCRQRRGVWRGEAGGRCGVGSRVLALLVSDKWPHFYWNLARQVAWHGQLYVQRMLLLLVLLWNFTFQMWVWVCVSECMCIEEIKIINKLNKSMWAFLCVRRSKFVPRSAAAECKFVAEVFWIYMQLQPQREATTATETARHEICRKY